MTELDGARIAVVHEWLLDYAGSERVLREILHLLPNADLFALVDLPDEELRQAIPRRAKATTFIQSLPFARRWLRYYVPLMPYAIEGLDLSGYDIVISSNHCVAKGVITGPDTLHVSYVHSPARYAWDLRNEYLRLTGLDRGLWGWAARRALFRLRQWDASTAGGPDAIVANSCFVARRIRKAWRREAIVIHPPVHLVEFRIEEKKEDFYLTVSRLQPYKRVDLLVEAFARMPERQLMIIGDGPEMAKLRRRVPRNVELLGYLPTAQVLEHMRRAKAFLFAGVEDFGIVMVEAQACGTPVIAFARGGAREIVRDGTLSDPTGILFREQTAAAIVDAVRHFEALPERFSAHACGASASRFSDERFRREFKELLVTQWQRFSLEPNATTPLR